MLDTLYFFRLKVPGWWKVPNSFKDILIEMKNISELMVDWAYSALLFNSKDAAEEVIKLENKVNRLNYEIKKESLLAARTVEDAEKLTALLEVGEAAETIADSAKDIADLVLKGKITTPFFRVLLWNRQLYHMWLNI